VSGRRAVGIVLAGKTTARIKPAMTAYFAIIGECIMIIFWAILQSFADNERYRDGKRE
jgi:hypothetical protein